MRTLVIAASLLGLVTIAVAEEPAGKAAPAAATEATPPAPGCECPAGMSGPGQKCCNAAAAAAEGGAAADASPAADAEKPHGCGCGRKRAGS